MNKSATYNTLALTIVAIEGATVKYRLTHDSQKRTFEWHCPNEVNSINTVAEISEHQLPKAFFVETATLSGGTQAWIKATAAKHETPLFAEDAAKNAFFEHPEIAERKRKLRYEFEIKVFEYED